MTLDTTPVYNLKAVVQETGVKPDTLRAWERRYGLPDPGRSEGGHRRYSERDIEIIRWLNARQEEGLAISQAVELFRQLEGEGKDPLRARATIGEPALAEVPRVGQGGALDELREAWIEAVLAFDESAADQVQTHAFALFPLEAVCIELLQRGLSEIGTRWYAGEVSEQQEHFASALAMRTLNVLVSSTPAPTRPGRVIVACPPDEDHDFAPLLLTLLLRRRGWDVVYLGADTPLARLDHTIDTVQPQLLVLIAQQLHTAATLRQTAAALAERVPIGFGGRIFNQAPQLRERVPGHFLGADLPAAVAEVERLTVRRAPEPSPGASPSEAHRRALARLIARQAQVEAQLWQQLEAASLPHAALAEIDTHFTQALTAALALDELALVEPELDWLANQARNGELPPEALQRYLTAFRDAVGTQLDADGQPLERWLDEVLASQDGHGS